MRIYILILIMICLTAICFATTDQARELREHDHAIALMLEQNQRELPEAEFTGAAEEFFTDFESVLQGLLASIDKEGQKEKLKNAGLIRKYLVELGFGQHGSITDRESGVFSLMLFNGGYVLTGVSYATLGGMAYSPCAMVDIKDLAVSYLGESEGEASILDDVRDSSLTSLREMIDSKNFAYYSHLAESAAQGIRELRKCFDVRIQTEGTTEGYSLQEAVRDAGLSQGILKHWSFDVVGNPPSRYIAVSTDEFPAGKGHEVWYDVSSAKMGGFPDKEN